MATRPAKKSLIPVERIASRIFAIRGEKVMLDADLAKLYGVATKVFNQAVRRNPERFPEDFMFQLTEEEANNLRSQIVTSSWGGQRYRPHAFTELGVAMLSSVLKSKLAIQVNLDIMRTFARLRQVLATSEELSRRVAQHDRQIAVLFDHVQRILAPVPSKKNPIGFIPPKG